MSKGRRRISLKRPAPQTKTQRLHDMCNELISHVKTLGDQQIELHKIAMEATAQVSVLANIIEILKQKGIITNEEIEKQIAESKAKVQDAEHDKCKENTAGVSSGSEESGSNDEVHIEDSERKPEVPADQSE